jgi:hypothetical protein
MSVTELEMSGDRLRGIIGELNLPKNLESAMLRPVRDKTGGYRLETTAGEVVASGLSYEMAELVERLPDLVRILDGAVDEIESLIVDLEGRPSWEWILLAWKAHDHQLQALLDLWIRFEETRAGRAFGWLHRRTLARIGYVAPDGSWLSLSRILLQLEMTGRTIDKELE